MKNPSLSANDVIAPDGYVFGGWENLNTGIVYDKFINVSDSIDGVTLKAVWITEFYKIQFDINGGTWGDGTQKNIQERTISKSFNNKELELSFLSLSANDVIAPDGYVFGGWENLNTGIIYDKFINVSDSIDGVTLKAVWDDDANQGNNNIDKSPPTGTLATILVSIIGISSLCGIVYYRKKIKN